MIKTVINIIFTLSRKIEQVSIKIRSFLLCNLFKKCGKNVNLGINNRFSYKNMEVGNNVSFGSNSCFLSSKALIKIGDHVLFGPHVYIITGNHRFDLKNRFIDEISDNEKCDCDDQDVIFEGDNWIGCGVIILKGVTIGYGSIIGAGAVVTKNVEPYSIYAGNPAKKIKNRYENENIRCS